MSVPLSTTLLSFNMDRPLNKAHWHERAAEAQLKQQNWDEAERGYNQAAEMMKKALDEVSTTSMAVPIQLQVEQLENMKNVIDKKRRAAERQSKSQNSSKQSFEMSSELKKTSAIKKESSKHVKKRENLSDKGTETSHVSKNHLKNVRQNTPPNTWQLVPRDIRQMIEEREKDSLLQFLLPEPEEDDLSSSTTRKRIPKSQEALLEEYKIRMDLLQTTAVMLVKALEDTEKENKSLKLEVSELRSQVTCLNEHLGIHEDNQTYRPLHFVEKDTGEPQAQKFTGDMMASMLIDQPESYFEFGGKDLETELQEATQETKVARRRRKATPPSGRGGQSVQYEDLEDGINTEVSDAISDSPSETNSAGSSLRFASLAGLPPLSPVHFEFDDKENIVTGPHGDLTQKFG